MSEPVTGGTLQRYDVGHPSWRVRVRRSLPLLMSLVVLIITMLVSRILQPNFFDRAVVRSNIATFLPLIMAAVGQTLVVLAGAIDLSIGGIITLVNVATVSLLGLQGASDSAGFILVALAGGLAVGILAGLINGFLVAHLRLQAIIATFATNFVWMGLALLVLPTPGGSIPTMVYRAYRGYFLGVPVAGWLVILVLGVWWLIRRTKLGRYIYAVGGSAPSAYAAGINVQRVIVAAYALCGLFAGMSGIALTADIASGDPLVGGPLTLSAVTAVVIGGTRLSGGVGGAGGSVAGAVILGLIRNIIFFANVPPFYQDFVLGLIVITALAIAAIGGMRRRSA